MSTLNFFSAVLAALLALAARPAFADAAWPTPPQPYRRPAALQQPVEPTTGAHLDATQRALQVAFNSLASFDNPNRSGRHSPANTINYGGYLARAREDLALALAATTEAIIFVSAHPESNSLAAGPVQAKEPKAPLLPALGSTVKITTGLRGQFTPNLETVVDAVNVALEALANNPAKDYHGPILGDIGGFRMKIITAIASVGLDLNSAISYYQNARGGSTGIIPLSAPANLSADPKFGPSARMYLEMVRPLLDDQIRNLSGVSGRDQGGYVAKVAVGLQRVSTDLTAAFAYLDGHPEATALAVGPAGREPSGVRRVTVPTFTTTATATSTMRAGRGAAAGVAARPALTPDTIRQLNTMLGWLLNNPDPGFRGPVLGDIGGHRGKIMDDLGQVLTDTLAGVAFANGQGPAAGAVSLLPLTFAVLAFGGLYFFLRKKTARAPATSRR